MLVGERQGVDDNGFVRCKQAGVVAEEVGRVYGACRVSAAGGGCLKRDWSAVISKAWARRERRRDRVVASMVCGLCCWAECSVSHVLMTSRVAAERLAALLRGGSGTTT